MLELVKTLGSAIRLSCAFICRWHSSEYLDCGIRHAHYVGGGPGSSCDHLSYPCRQGHYAESGGQRLTGKGDAANRQ